MSRERSPETRLAAALALAITLRASPAAAQACCAGAALINPAHLALHEDYALGVQARVRAELGSFAPEGGFTRSATEQDFEQDLAASLRLSERSQAGLELPFVETRRIESGTPAWGSGVGDLAVNARYDFLFPTEALHWPGVALLADLVVPTGKPPGEGSNPSSTDATGTGTYNVSLGVELQKLSGPFYFGLDGWLSYLWSRTVMIPGNATLTTDFPLQWAVLAVAGYVFDDEAAVGVYANVLGRGDDQLNGVLQPATALRLTTVGLSGVLPFHDIWRIQGALFNDVMVSGFGRNELGGLGASAALVRVWL